MNCFFSNICNFFAPPLVQDFPEPLPQQTTTPPPPHRGRTSTELLNFCFDSDSESDVVSGSEDSEPEECSRLTEADRLQEREQALIQTALNEFPLESVLVPHAIIILGPRASGKTTLLNKLQTHFWDTAALYEADFQTELEREAFPTLLNPIPGADVRPSIYLYDDYKHDTNPRNRYVPQLNNIFLNSRHENSSAVVAAQSVFEFSPELRCNAEFLFVFKSSEKEYNKIWEYWFNMVSKKVFMAWVTKYTTEHSCLVIDVVKSAKSITPTDFIFYAKATL